VAGWRLIFVGLGFGLASFLINNYAEPMTYQVFPPSPTITLTPTATLTPTISLPPTISLTPTIADTPSVTNTPSLPQEVQSQFESTITPAAVPVFSSLIFATSLDENFQPTVLVASVAVLVEPPYREAHTRLSEAIFKEVDEAYDVIVHEAQLCQVLLDTGNAVVVHVDSSLGGVPVDELSPVELSNLKISVKAKGSLLKILPKLRRTAGEIRRKHAIETLAIGKESVAVRIAELTAGAEAVVYACGEALEEKKPLLLGLPTKCQHRVADGKVYLYSLIDAEHDVRGYAVDNVEVLSKVVLTEMLNPVARGFRILKITPKI